VLAVLGGFVLLLTQVEFPALYWRFLDMQPESVAIVVTRNTLLVVFFAFAAWRLWGLAYAKDEEQGSQELEPGR